MHAVLINGAKTPTVIQPESHGWRPTRSDHSWEIRTGYAPYQSAGTVVERYTPPKKPNAGPVITPYRGSWPDQANQRRQASPVRTRHSLSWPIGSSK